MAGLSNSTPQPTAITVHQQSRVLEVGFSDGQTFRIPFELMRIYSPSAEVQGHGPGQEVLQTGKREVELTELEPVGNYAVQPSFSDGHDSGIYSWDYLYHLGAQQDELWQRYEARLREAGVDIPKWEDNEASLDDLRARVNPQYYDQIGTESYERNQCVLALESLLARIEVLRVQNAALRADADRIDWLADVDNTVGSVVLPREIVEANISSLRQAIDAARGAKITQEPAL